MECNTFIPLYVQVNVHDSSERRVRARSTGSGRGFRLSTAGVAAVSVTEEEQRNKENMDVKVHEFHYFLCIFGKYYARATIYSLPSTKSLAM